MPQDAMLGQRCMRFSKVLFTVPLDRERLCALTFQNALLGTMLGRRRMQVHRFVPRDQLSPNPKS